MYATAGLFNKNADPLYEIFAPSIVFNMDFFEIGRIVLVKTSLPTIQAHDTGRPTSECSSRISGLKP